MAPHDNVQIGLFLFLLTAFSPILGWYIARVFDEQKPFRPFILAAIERLIYRMSLVDPGREMNWKQYAVAVLLFHGFGFLALLGLELGLFQYALSDCPAQLMGGDRRQGPQNLGKRRPDAFQYGYVQHEDTSLQFCRGAEGAK